MTNLLMVLSWAVIPKLNPTVLQAEKHSNAISSKLLSLSKIDINIIAKPITNNDNEIESIKLNETNSKIEKKSEEVYSNNNSNNNEDNNNNISSCLLGNDINNENMLVKKLEKKVKNFEKSKLIN